jgi:hypothetical protein
MGTPEPARGGYAGCLTLSRIPQLTLDDVSEGQTWNSEDIRLCSFTVLFCSWQAIVMKFGYMSKTLNRIIIEEAV